MELISWCSIDDNSHSIAAYEMDLPKSCGPNDSDYNRSMITCPSCGHPIELYDQDRIQELPGLPAGVKFDPVDHEILEHLQAKVMEDGIRLHPLIDEFIPTLEGENGICCTHPEKLPGVRRDGPVRHFFHRPSKAYTTGTRKRRKVGTGQVKTEGEARWHKTGKTRPILADGMLKGFKKILVLYTNYGKQRKPEKTNWVMHQYHLGDKEDEKDGELVASKVFYQTQPRVCGSTRNKDKESIHDYRNKRQRLHGKQLLEEYGYGNSGHVQSGYEFIQHNQNREMMSSPQTIQLIPNGREDEPLFAQFVGKDEQTWKKAV